MDKNVQLHLHSSYSLNDATIEAGPLLERLHEMGCTAFATTDHGNFMAVEEFFSAVKKFNKASDANIKYIPGVELYVEAKDARAHLVVLPKDEIGLKALYRVVTKSHGNLDTKGFPITTMEMLEEYLAPGKEAHGHVIALSACMQGVLATELRHNSRLEKEACKIEAKIAKIALDADAYEKIKADLEQLEWNLAKAKEHRVELSELKGKTFTKRKKDLERALAKGSISEDDYLSQKEALDKEIEESLEATKAYPAAKETEAALSKACTALRAEVKKLDVKAERVEEILAAATEIRHQKISTEEMFENAKRTALSFRYLFGEGNFYAEMQYHGIPEEAEIFPQVARIAEELGLPFAATNDAHILTNTEDGRRRRQYLRSLRYNKWEEEMAGDDQLYVKTDEELREALSQILPEHIIDMAFQGNTEIASKCNVVRAEGEEHYPKFKPEGGKTTDGTMRELLNKGWVEKLGFKKGHPDYELYHQRVEYELEIIKKLKVVDYLLIVQDFLEYGRLLGRIDLKDERYLADPYNKELLKELSKDRVGFGIGIGRGSAVGSLVCYLIGITGADPIKYNLFFERFLNTERVTMPKQYWALNVNFIAQRCAA